MRRKLTGMACSMLRRLALAGMVAFLLGAAPLAQAPEPAQDDSIEALRTRANAGDVDGQYNLGAMYANGRGVPQDAVEAVAWYRQAAEQGQVGSMSMLGFHYLLGDGVREDDVEAYKWFILATTYTDASEHDKNYVCSHFSCQEPINDPARLDAQLTELGSVTR